MRCSVTRFELVDASGSCYELEGLGKEREGENGVERQRWRLRTKKERESKGERSKAQSTPLEVRVRQSRATFPSLYNHECLDTRPDSNMVKGIHAH